MAGLVILALTIVSRQAGSRAAAQAASTDARASAISMFGERCAVCHGQNGDGKGPASESLNPRPIDFRDRKWQKSVTDAKIAKAIVYGGPAVELSASMTANPDLETQPGVVAALVSYIRALGDRKKQ
jgi:mono/diheme cytochrome c family protein